MSALVVYESVYGNTRTIAEAIADGIGGAEVRPVSEVGYEVAQFDLVVAGGPTHMHGMTTKRSRELAAEVGREDAEVAIDPCADAEPGLRTWLHALPDAEGTFAAAFDTRLDNSPFVTGLASRGIARRLRRRGYELIGMESFLVEESEGPLAGGEIDRAREWGAELAMTLTTRATGSI